jgi:hypothetical protein
MMSKKLISINGIGFICTFLSHIMGQMGSGHDNQLK